MTSQNNTEDSKKNLLSVKNLSVIKNEQTLLDNVSLDIGNKDFITIIGPNGAGKSIFLKSLLGLIKPTKGSIAKKSSLTFGYMPQVFSVNRMIPLSVKNFFYLNTTTTKQLFNQIVEQIKLSHLLDKQLYQLSGGQIQRMLLARALIQQPDILVLDEPAQNLDISGQLEFYKMLDDIFHSRKISIIMVSHDLHFVMNTSTQVICLFKHICCSGNATEVTNSNAFIELFGKDLTGVLKQYQHGINHAHHHHSHT